MASTSYDVSIDCDEVSDDENTNTDSIKRVFYQKLVRYDDMHSGSNKRPWTRKRILEVIADLKNIRVTMKKKSVDYYWMSKYDVVTTPTEEYLIAKKNHPTEPTVRIVAREQYFDLLSLIHLSRGHAGRDKMLQELKFKYYIPKKAVEIFLSLCQSCENRKYGSHKCDNNVRRPFQQNNQNEGGHFDFIDFCSCPDGDYKWLLNYENIVSKFTILRPLKTINTDEVAMELLKIFFTFGAPCTLQSKQGKDLTACVLKEISKMWPDCDITCGVQKTTQNEDIKTLLQSWMKENNSKNWSFGCYYVQYFKNTLLHPTLGKLPYEELFGYKPKTGLILSPIVNKEVTSGQSLMSLTVYKEVPIKKCSTASSILKPIGVDTGDGLTPSSILTDKNSSSVIKSFVSVNDQDKTGHEVAFFPTEKEAATIPGFIKIEEIMLDDDVKSPTDADEDISNPSDQETHETSFDNSNIKQEINILNYTLAPHSNSDSDLEQEINPSSTLCSKNKKQKKIKSSLLSPSKNEPNAFQCKSCKSTSHIIRGVIDFSEGQRLKVSCSVCKCEQDMLLTKKTQKRPAQALGNEPTSKMPAFDVGNSVLVDVPVTRRGPLNTKTVKGKIVDYRNGVYRVATNIGVIKNWFSRYDLQLYDTDYGSTSSTPVTLDEVVASQPSDGHQKCSCKPSVSQCQHNRCYCFKNKLMCGPKCHDSLACVNT